MSIEGMERQKYLIDKFNVEESARKIYKSIDHEGLKNNIHFQFDKIRNILNSFA